MTDQEIIDDIYAKLQAQPGIAAYYRCRSSNHTYCMYKDEDGNKCAVGLSCD